MCIYYIFIYMSVSLCSHVSCFCPTGVFARSVSPNSFGRPPFHTSTVNAVPPFTVNSRRFKAHNCKRGAQIPESLPMLILTQSYISKGIRRQGIGSFCEKSPCFNTTPCRHMPLLVHFWLTCPLNVWSPVTLDPSLLMELWKPTVNILFVYSV